MSRLAVMLRQRRFVGVHGGDLVASGLDNDSRTVIMFCQKRSMVLRKYVYSVLEIVIPPLIFRLFDKKKP